MPRSSSEGKEIIKEWLSYIDIEYNKILDIGAGQGTYFNLFSNLSNLKNTKWYGIEIWPRWIKKFNLKEKYDYVFEEDARLFDYQKHGPFDIVFAGDILEHMSKEDAVKLVNTLQNISKKIFISIPIVYMPQGADFGNPYEEHIKPDWTHDEVLESFSNIINFHQGQKIGVYQIDGK